MYFYNIYWPFFPIFCFLLYQFSFAWMKERGVSFHYIATMLFFLTYSYTEMFSKLKFEKKSRSESNIGSRMNFGSWIFKTKNLQRVGKKSCSESNIRPRMSFGSWTFETKNLRGIGKIVFRIQYPVSITDIPERTRAIGHLSVLRNPAKITPWHVHVYF